MAQPDTPCTFQVIEFARRNGAARPSSLTTLSYAGDVSATAEYQPLDED